MGDEMLLNFFEMLFSQSVIYENMFVLLKKYFSICYICAIAETIAFFGPSLRCK